MVNLSSRRQPAEESPRSLVRIVVDRIRRQIPAPGAERYLVHELSQAVSAELERQSLDREERRAHASCAKRPESDPVAAVLAARVEKALRVGLGVARRRLQLEGELDHPAVYVVRRPDPSSPQGLDTQVSTALSAVRKRIGPGQKDPIERGSLYLLANTEIFEKLRTSLPAPKAGAELPVFFTGEERETEQSGAASAAEIEIVRADQELPAIEERLAGMLALRAKRKGDTTIEAEADDDPLIGTLFHNKYRILEKIGRGGFGSVYEARDERGAGNRVAIKTLRPEAAHSPVHLQSFKNEARRVTRLDHPNIVDWKVFDETEDGTQYFVMELVKGEELDRVLAREGRLPAERVGKIMLQVLDALRTAHHLGEDESVLHLDLKPRNVFIVPGRKGIEEKVKVFDFGVGQYIGGENEEEISADEDADTLDFKTSSDTEDSFNPTTINFVHTDQRSISIPERSRASDRDTPTPFKRSTACTPEYASPEQCAHILGSREMVALDGRSDLYSLGVMAFQLLTGDLPFPRPLVRTDMLRIQMRTQPRKLGSMRVKVPKKLARFIDRCLEKDREKRFADTSEAYEGLREIVHPQAWKKAALILAPVVLVLALAGGYSWKRFGAPAETVTFAASARGIDPAKDTIYLGPESESTLLSFRADSPQPGYDPDAAWSVVRADDGTPLEGWSAGWEGESGVRLEGPARVSGREEIQAALKLSGSRKRLETFSAVWLGPDSWKPPTVLVGDVATSELGERVVDAYGQHLDILVDGLRDEDLESVSVTVDGKPHELTEGASTAGTRRFRLPFSLLELAGTELASLEVEVKDASGRVRGETLALPLTFDRLQIEKMDLYDAAGPQSADSDNQEEDALCNRIGGTYSISSRTQPQLRVRLNQTAKLTYTILNDAKAKLEGDFNNPAKREHDNVSLPKLSDYGGNYRGFLRVLVDDNESVLRADRDRGQVLRDIPFHFADLNPTFWVHDGGNRPLPKDEPVYTGDPEAKLHVDRDGHTIPMRVTVAWSNGLGESREPEQQDFRSPGDREKVFPLEFRGDGEYEVLIRSYRFDSNRNEVSERPDSERGLTYFLDTEAPAIALGGIDSGRTVTQSEELLALTACSPAGRSPGASPIRFGWSLWRGTRMLHEDSTKESLAAGEVVPLPIDLPQHATVDGPYELKVWALDLANNRSEPESVEFVVARNEPLVEFKRPSSVGSWTPSESGSWELEFEVRDENGIQDVKCTVQGHDGQVKEVVLRPASNSRLDMKAYEGSLPLPPEWSRTKANVVVNAIPAHGKPAEASWPVTLGEIKPATPLYIEVAFGGIDVEPMRLIDGNSSEYAFGGQDDYRENDRFKDAGLDPFNTRPRASQLSWNLIYEIGEIKDFYLDEREVSVRQYLAFLRADNGYLNSAHWPQRSSPDEKRAEELESQLVSLDLELPVTSVSWPEAFAYAHWVGKRLPSLVEWELAVRSKDYRPHSAFVVGEPPPQKQTGSARICGSGDDITPDSLVMDLCTNVSEWTSSPVYFQLDGRPTGDPEDHAKRNRLHFCDPTDLENWSAFPSFWVAGGSFKTKQYHFFVADQRRRSFSGRSLGFRCALSLDQMRLGLDRSPTDSTPAFRQVAR